jgi:hypothetical protein
MLRIGEYLRARAQLSTILRGFAGRPTRSSLPASTGGRQPMKYLTLKISFNLLCLY